MNWVENGVASDQILALGGGRTQPLCLFPQRAIYNGSGGTDDAANCHCGGDLQNEATIYGGLLRYKKETKNTHDTMGQHNPSTCE